MGDETKQNVTQCPNCGAPLGLSDVSAIRWYICGTLEQKAYTGTEWTYVCEYAAGLRAQRDLFSDACDEFRAAAEKAERELAKQERLTLEVMEDRDKAEHERDGLRSKNRNMEQALQRIESKCDEALHVDTVSDIFGMCVEALSGIYGEAGDE